jgi:hypothetical protein
MLTRLRNAKGLLNANKTFATTDQIKAASDKATNTQHAQEEWNKANPASDWSEIAQDMGERPIKDFMREFHVNEWA